MITSSTDASNSLLSLKRQASSKIYKQRKNDPFVQLWVCFNWSMKVNQSKAIVLLCSPLTRSPPEYHIPFWVLWLREVGLD